MDSDFGSAILQNPGSWNRYAYVSGDPVNNNDPSGLNEFNNGCSYGIDFCATGYGSSGVSVCMIDPELCSPWGTGPETGDPGGGGYSGTTIATFGSAKSLSVTGYSRTGPQEQTISDDLTKIQNQVLTGDCATWLAGAGSSASDMINAIMTAVNGGPSFGYGALNDNTTAAFVGNTNTDGTTVAGLPIDSSITVNSNGAFFNSAYTVGSGTTQYAGGSLQAQIFILVHELGHLAASLGGAAGFLPDAGNQANENSNNRLVQKECGKQIAGVH